MRRATILLAVIAAAAVTYAATALFSTPTESKWSVTSGGKQVATMTVLTDGRSVRAEWKASGAAIVFLGGSDKAWVRGEGGDVEVATYKGGAEKAVAPALLLPYLTSTTDKVTNDKGKPASYTFGSSKASYTHDAKGLLSSVAVTAAGTTYTVARLSIGKPTTSSASLYTIRPKKKAATAIASMAGGLFGSSSTNVSATAGGRGVTGFKLADGGDYTAVDKILTRDDEAKEKIASELDEFQTEGRVGRAQGGQK